MFNEALSKVVAEKEKRIEELVQREATLQADSDKYRSEYAQHCRGQNSAGGRTS